MDENTLTFRIVSLVAAVVIVITLSITSYNIVDRYFQGHAVIISPQTVQVIK